ncbi:MAG TPA: hypothetical protein VFC19_32355 [Candidatus Limnocylindrales bacterium]|nr:hypothetical protein [Candidatus Limnocylindrales bacterium]
MSDVVTLAISIGSLLISISTAWLTLLRRGRLRATQPTLFYIGPDGASGDEHERRGSKVFIRTMLYSTGIRGRMIENMYVVVRCGNLHSVFSIWIYRDGSNLSRGSGLFVGHGGLALDHHFLRHVDDQYTFVPGDYTVDLYAQSVGERQPHLLISIQATLSVEISKEAETNGGGVFFDWIPGGGKYYGGEYYAYTRPAPRGEDIAQWSPRRPVLRGTGGGNDFGSFWR